MKDCIFCKITFGEIPAEKIYEDEKVLAFLDINPVNKGHALIIPKEHFEMMYDTPDDILSHIFIQAKKLMMVIKNATKADFVVVTVVGLDVPHFHAHLVPRFFNDGLSNWWPKKKYEEGEMEKISKEIRKHLTT